MTVSSREKAWKEVNKLFPTDYEKDEQSSSNAGYDIYRHSTLNFYNWISDLGCRLEVNLGSQTINIWIEDVEQKYREQLIALARQFNYTTN